MSGYINNEGYFVQVAEDFPPEGSPATQQAQAVATNPDSTAWDRLSAGKTIGRSVNLYFGGEGGAGTSTEINFLEIKPTGGGDRDTLQLGLHISPPKFLNADNAAAVQNIEQLQGPFGYISGLVTNPPPALASAQMPRLYVRLTWGLGSVENTVEVDISNGAVANLGPASYVRGTVFYEFELQGSPPPLIFQLSAAVGPTVPKDVGCTRTVRVYDGTPESTTPIDSGNDSQLFPIPNYARRVMLLGVSPTGAPSGTINFWQGGSSSNIVAQALLSAGVTGWVPIPNGCSGFSVTSGTNGSYFDAIFDLAI